jgi:hypothetical protein
MKDFVIKYKNVLKKFRLTGTQSTMKMLGEVVEGDDIVSCLVQRVALAHLEEMQNSLR